MIQDPAEPSLGHARRIALIDRHPRLADKGKRRVDVFGDGDNLQVETRRGVIHGAGDPESVGRVRGQLDNEGARRPFTASRAEGSGRPRQAVVPEPDGCRVAGVDPWVHEVGGRRGGCDVVDTGHDHGAGRRGDFIESGQVGAERLVDEIHLHVHQHRQSVGRYVVGWIEWTAVVQIDLRIVLYLEHRFSETPGGLSELHDVAAG